MEGLPIYWHQAKFRATGYSNSFEEEAIEGRPLPLQRIPSKIAIQVTGLDAAGARLAATAWEVELQGSLDMLAYDSDAGAMLTHKSGTNADGDCVRSDGKLMISRAMRVHVRSLTLGAADSILVTVVAAK